MRFSELYKRKQRTFSFEFFPPKTEEAEKSLFQTVARLKTLRPSFVSVTYGAMGTTREGTIRIVSRIKNEIGIEAAAHLTCVGQSKFEIEKILAELKSKNIENIFALRGDPPKGDKEFKPVPNGFAFAAELTRYIRSHPSFAESFDLAVAGYPECHIECRDQKKDLEHLKMKVDAGANAVITQLFFNNRNYFDFVERAQKIGIRIPVIPGIMPITHGPQIKKFSQMCGASIPREIEQAINRFGEDQASVEAYGIDYATRQCAELLKNGVAGIHFYTLNKSQATSKIYAELGLIQPSHEGGRG